MLCRGEKKNATFPVFMERKGSSKRVKDCNGKARCCGRRCSCACPLGHKGTYRLEMLDRLLALSFRWLGITVWEVATDLRTRDFERPCAEVSHFLAERVTE